MAMRSTSAGTLKTTRTSNPRSFRTAAKTRHLFEDDSSSVSDASNGLQLNIPHMKTVSSAPFQTHEARHSTMLQPKNVGQSSIQDEEETMLQFLNRQQRQDDSQRDSRMPETWSVKLPAYHQSQSVREAPKSPRKASPTRDSYRVAETWSVKLPAYHQTQSPTIPSQRTSRKYPPPSSMFRGSGKVSSAVASSFSEMMLDEEQFYLQERREQISSISEKDEKKRWKPWSFLA